MTAQEKAKAGVWLLKQALLDYLANRPEGEPAAKIREDLGLDQDADTEGQHKGFLLWGLVNLLKNVDGMVEINRDVSPQRIRLRARREANA